MIKFENVKEQLTHDDLTNFEKKNKLTLPEAYKKHLLTYNGGYPEKEYFQGIEIAYFNSIKYGKSTLLQDVLDMIGDILPKDYLPIAYDGGDNQICIYLKEGDKYGYIYYLPMDMGEIEPEFLAKSLNEFLEGLSDDGDW
jgi:cell wall assembly regulator SMI1